MRTLIFGGKGQLGRDLVRRFGGLGAVQGLDLPEMDIADSAMVTSAAERFKPDLVVNAAAFTDVERAEDEREAAFRVNEQGARYVAEAAGRAGAPVVYYSTDFVFAGGKSSPYEVDEPVAPHGVYAESKAAGEAATRDACPRYFIVRTAWLYGPGGNNFVEKILRAAESRPSLRVVSDEVGSPTHTYDLAEATAALAATESYGIYHAVNQGACSRCEFAQAIIEQAGLGTPVEPCEAAEYPSKAPRPDYSVLSTARLAEATGYVMRPWRDALTHYMQRRSSES